VAKNNKRSTRNIPTPETYRKLHIPCWFTACVSSFGTGTAVARDQQTDVGSIGFDTTITAGEGAGRGQSRSAHLDQRGKRSRAQCGSGLRKIDHERAAMNASAKKHQCIWCLTT
jgi:hypothetical protein